ncbi:MAG: hypothetical protein CMJ64_00055 [Planctomycetaceae bacterium]|nr:hypothetical protein [Planctomycetaceae bacterium]
MKKLLTLCALAFFGLAIGCGERTAPPATEAEQEAVQAPVDDYMKKMGGMNSAGMKDAPDFSGGAGTEAAGTEASEAPKE